MTKFALIIIKRVLFKINRINYRYIQKAINRYTFYQFASYTYVK